MYKTETDTFHAEMLRWRFSFTTPSEDEEMKDVIQLSVLLTLVIVICMVW